MGRTYGREDRAADGVRAASPAPCRLSRRLRRRAYHRPGRPVPRTSGSGPHLRQPGAPVGQGSAGVLPVRALGRRWGVYPRVLRRRLHGRGERVDVSRFASDGRGRDRRARVARRDGRRAHACNSEWLRRQPVCVGRGGDRAGAALLVLPAVELDEDGAGRGAGSATRRRAPYRGGRTGRGATRVRHARRSRRADRRPLLLRGEAVVGARDHRRVRAPRGRTGRDSRQQSEASRRRAVRRLGRQGRALHLAVRRVQRAAGVPRGRAGVHDRRAGGARGDHSSRCEDDHRGGRGDGSQVLGHRAQGVRCGLVRDVRARVRPRRVSRAADRADRGDGSRPGCERGVLQPDPRNRGCRRARRVRRGAP